MRSLRRHRFKKNAMNHKRKCANKKHTTTENKYHVGGVLLTVQRAELLKQECQTGKVVSDMHRLGPENTQKLQMN